MAGIDRTHDFVIFLSLFLGLVIIFFIFLEPDSFFTTTS